MIAPVLSLLHDPVTGRSPALQSKDVLPANVASAASLIKALLYRIL